MIVSLGLIPSQDKSSKGWQRVSQNSVQPMQVSLTKPLTGFGWQSVSQDSSFPSVLRRGKGKMQSSKQAKGRKFPTLGLLAALGWGVSFSDAPPLFLWQGREGLALSQTGCMRSYLTRGPMGIIPSGMIPHWESTATSIQHIQVSCSRR